MSRKGKRADSKAGWILYLMVHFPLVFFVKIGITGRSAAKRAHDLDEAMPGFPVPVFVAVLPGAYALEQTLHHICAPMSVRFYSGDGASEWFFLPAVIIALPVMLCVWGVYFWIISVCTNWDALAWYIDLLRVVGGWATAWLLRLLGK